MLLSLRSLPYFDTNQAQIFVRNLLLLTKWVLIGGLVIGFCSVASLVPSSLVSAFYTVHSRVLSNACSFFQLVCLQLSSAPDPVLETVSGIFHSSDIFFQRKILRIGGSP